MSVFKNLHHTVSISLDIEARFRDHSATCFRRLGSFFKPYFGAHGAREIPVLIPNTEVKPCSGDYTATSGKLARCRIIKRASEQEALFLIRNFVNYPLLASVNPGD